MFDMQGKKGLVVGIANENSIAWGCTKVFHESGADLLITYLNEKARPYVEPLSVAVSADMFMPLDVTQPDQLEAVFKAIASNWKQLDFVLHSIAFAPIADLHGRVVDSSEEGFLLAMNISCHSFIRMARHAEALMSNGGSLLTMSYYGSEKVVPNYGIMGPVKATLEASVRYMAVELGEKNIRVNAISPGPVATRAASGIAEFNKLLETSREKAPLRSATKLGDIGNLAAFLASDASGGITGGVHYVDSGYNLLGY